MSNMRLIVTNLHDTAFVTATSEALPVRNTQVSARARPWRSTGVVEESITADMPTPKFLDAVVLYRHNLSEGAEARLLMRNKGEIIFDSGFLSSSDRIPLGTFQFGIDAWGASLTGSLPIQQMPFWTPKLVADSYTVTIRDPGNTDGFISLGRVISGESFSPKINPDYDLPLEWQDFSEHRRTEGESLRTSPGGLSRRLELNLSYLDDYDRRKLTNEMLKNGKGNDVYLSVLPEAGGMDEGEYAFLARRDTNHAHTHNFYKNWKTSITFVEV